MADAQGPDEAGFHPDASVAERMPLRQPHAGHGRRSGTRSTTREGLPTDGRLGESFDEARHTGHQGQELARSFAGAGGFFSPCVRDRALKAAKSRSSPRLPASVRRAERAATSGEVDLMPLTWGSDRRSVSAIQRI